MILTLSLLKDGEAQDVFDSIQKLACVSKSLIYLINEAGVLMQLYILKLL